MIRIFFIFYISLFLFAKTKTEITAQKFELNGKEHITKFIGDVRVAQDEDRIYSDYIEVFTNKQNKPIKYVAKDNVRFKIKNDKDYYRGTCDKLIYLPKDLKYILIGNARVDENNDTKVLIGDKIIINRSTGKAKVFGGKKPVKFIFDNED